MGVRAKSKYIQDPLYGMVYLSELEMRVIDSDAFQRLHNVKQLGSTFFVFPGADYSRFSHCIGACQVMQRWLGTLEECGTPIAPARAVLYRLAALLHDVGHYPFSHATERAARNYYAELLESTAKGTTVDPCSVEDAQFSSHEKNGEDVVMFDPQISAALLEAGLSGAALANVFKHYSRDGLVSLLSSDLDVDRVDYLPRTAHHSGLPYGNVDGRYLLTHIRLDNNERICWTEHALGAIDHALIARYFDYQQIVHNKTVVALEMVLERLVQELLVRHLIDLSSGAIRRQLKNHTWVTIDDHYMIQRIRELLLDSCDETVRELCRSLLLRNPPRNLYRRAFIAEFSVGYSFQTFVDTIKLMVDEIADRHGIDRRLWFVWGQAFPLTKYQGGPFIDHSDEGTIQELYQIPYILQEGGDSLPIIEDARSLTRLFYTKRRFEVRVYLLIPEMLEPAKRISAQRLRAQMEQLVRVELARIATPEIDASIRSPWSNPDDGEDPKLFED